MVKKVKVTSLVDERGKRSSRVKVYLGIFLEGFGLNILLLKISIYFLLNIISCVNSILCSNLIRGEAGTTVEDSSSSKDLPSSLLVRATPGQARVRDGLQRAGQRLVGICHIYSPLGSSRVQGGGEGHVHLRRGGGGLVPG